MWHGVSPVPAPMWQGVSQVPVQMWLPVFSLNAAAGCQSLRCASAALWTLRKVASGQPVLQQSATWNENALMTQRMQRAPSPSRWACAIKNCRSSLNATCGVPIRSDRSGLSRGTPHGTPRATVHGRCMSCAVWQTGDALCVIRGWAGVRCVLYAAYVAARRALQDAP